MKLVKKSLSLVLSLALIIGVFVAFPTTTVSAAAGDTFEVTGIPDNWKWYSSGYVTRENNGAKFGVNANKGNGLDNYGILACNSQSADIIKAGTTYKIELRIETWFTLDKLQIDIDTGTALWSRTKQVTTISDLDKRAYDIVGGGSSKLYATVSFTITTPTTISGNQHFVIGVIPKSGGTGGVANLRFYNIKITELGTYTVVDESGNVLDTVHGVPGDDVLTLVNNSEANKDGLEIESVSPATIAADTTTIVVNYKKEEVEEQPIVVTFDETYLQNKPNAWTYYQEGGSGRLTISNGAMKALDDSNPPNSGTSFGDRAFLATNNYAEYLTPGAAYQVKIKVSLFTQYVSLDKLNAEIKFGTGVWKVTSGAPTYSYNGAQLEEMVTNNPTASSSGSVVFEITTYVTAPESGNNNLLISLYGAQYFIQEVIITPAVEFSVVDETGAHIGNVPGMIGDKAFDLIPDSFMTDVDYIYSTNIEVVEDILVPIVLKKTLKPNITQKITFTSSEYGGNNDPNGQYYSKEAGSAKFVNQTTQFKGDKINKGVTFGHRALLLANDRANSGLVAGETYRIIFSFSTWYYLEASYGLEIRFGETVWNTVGDAIIYEGNELTALVSKFTDGKGSKSNAYTLAIDVTIPEDEHATNIAFSLYGTGDKQVEYFFTKAYIKSQSEAEVITYNEEYFASVKGFEGDAIGEVISTNGAVKFVNITDTFGFETVKVKSNDVIYRGDANQDGVIDEADLTLLREYLANLVSVDEFGLNAFYGDNVINALDIARLKSIINGTYVVNKLPETLKYNDYELVWNYEFSDSKVNADVINSASGFNQIEDIKYVTVGDKNCVNVDNGVLTMSPKYNYGQMLASDAFSTQNTMNFAYGYFEIRAKLSYSAANLPAIWFKTDGGLSNTGDNDVLEYDLLETFGNTSAFKHNVHYWDGQGNTYNSNNTVNREYAFESTAAAGQYHVYGFEWYYDEAEECSYITLYVDGVKQGTLSAKDINHRWYQDVPEDFDRPMYLILQNQIITEAYAQANSSWISGREATAEDFPMDMCIDYVRLYQSASNADRNVLVTK